MKTCFQALKRAFDKTHLFGSSEEDDTLLDNENPANEGFQECAALVGTGYRFVKELGMGLQGRVVLARSEHDGEAQYVALKLPTFETRADGPRANDVDLLRLDCQVQSLMQEREALRRVHHDNVLQYKRSVRGEKDRHVYVMLAMEYARNGDLFDVIAHTGALREDLCQFYGLQLIRAVQACHAAGVIHRDVKPENILFDDAFTLKLCDFGLASVVSPKAKSSADMWLRDVEGTALYMAPEIDSGAKFRGPPVDVWACGVVLFIMLTGFPPFDDADENDELYNLVRAGRMDAFWAAQPSALEPPSDVAKDLLQRMLCDDPAKRITIPEILAHPWLRDAEEIRHASVMNKMKMLRRACQ